MAEDAEDALARDIDTALEAALGEAVRQLQRTEAWYALRFQRLRDLAYSLPEPQRTQLYFILANGVADEVEPPSYADLLKRLEQQRATAREELATLRRSLLRTV